MSVGPAIRGLVRFERLNLCADAYPKGPFDLVLCRNVLIYFDSETRDRVVAASSIVSARPASCSSATPRA